MEPTDAEIWKAADLLARASKGQPFETEIITEGGRYLIGVVRVDEDKTLEFVI
jgi:hypothetical protein